MNGLTSGLSILRLSVSSLCEWVNIWRVNTKVLLGVKILLIFIIFCDKGKFKFNFYFRWKDAEISWNGTEPIL